jgi:hypothetical protein
LLVVLLLAVSCGGAPARVPAADRGADLDALVRAVETRHPEPFRFVSEDRWRADVAALRARAAALSPDEFLVAVARLANLGRRNGHGGVFPTDQPDLPIWPVRLYEFAEGWHVVAARDASLVGARVTAVGGRPVADVAALLAPVVPYDNEHSRRARLATYLVTPAFLRGVGAYGPLTVVRDGVTRDVTPAEGPPAEYATLAGLDVPQIPPALPRPPFAPADDWFWLVRRGDALVVGYERVVQDMQDGKRVQWLVQEIENAVASAPPRVLVVDVRRNPGGENSRAMPLLIALRDLANAGRVKVRVLVSRATYSAASLMFSTLRRSAPPVTFYGEPTGGGTDTYGNPGAERLPASGIVVQVAGAPSSAPGREAEAIVPDVRVTVTAKAWFAGRDEVLAAALR